MSRRRVDGAGCPGLPPPARSAAALAPPHARNYIPLPPELSPPPEVDCSRLPIAPSTTPAIAPAVPPMTAAAVVATLPADSLSRSAFFMTVLAARRAFAGAAFTAVRALLAMPLTFFIIPPRRADDFFFD